MSDFTKDPEGYFTRLPRELKIQALTYLEQNHRDQLAAAGIQTAAEANRQIELDWCNTLGPLVQAAENTEQGWELRADAVTKLGEAMANFRASFARVPTTAELIAVVARADAAAAWRPS